MDVITSSRNIFKADGGITGSFSVPIILKLQTSPDSKLSTLALYMGLLTRATGPLFRVPTGELLEQTGLSRPVLIAARNQLSNPKGLNLIRCAETTKQGVWEYELLNEKGGKLATFADFVVFRDQPAEFIKAYYCDRLGVTDCLEDSEGNLLFVCPFHSSTKDKPTLKVTIAHGEDFHGRFICGNRRRCRKNGGLIAFESAMAEKRGEVLTQTQAAQLVRTFIVGMMQVDEEHPAIAAYKAFESEGEYELITA
jgi:hypothetical protein